MTQAEQLTSLFKGVDEQLRIAAGLEALNAYQRKHGAEPRFTDWYRRHAGLEDLGEGIEGVAEAADKTWETIKRFVAVLIKALKDGWNALTGRRRKQQENNKAAKELGADIARRRREIEAAGKTEKAQWAGLAYASPLLRETGTLSFTQLAKDIAADQRVWLETIAWLQQRVDSLEQQAKKIFSGNASAFAPLMMPFQAKGKMLGGVSIEADTKGFPVFVLHAENQPVCQAIENPFKDIGAIDRTLSAQDAVLKATDAPLEKLHSDAEKTVAFIGRELARGDWDRGHAPQLRTALDVLEQTSKRAVAIVNYHIRQGEAVKRLMEHVDREAHAGEKASTESLELDYSNWGNLF